MMLDVSIYFQLILTQCQLNLIISISLNLFRKSHLSLAVVVDFLVFVF